MDPLYLFQLVRQHWPNNDGMKLPPIFKTQGVLLLLGVCVCEGGAFIEGVVV